MTDTIKISRELRPLLERIESFLSRHVCAAPSGKVATELHAELAALLSTPPADAADMGGQAGEDRERNRAFKACPNSGCDWGAFYLGWKAKAKDLVSIRAALESQHRQRAGKLVEALRRGLGAGRGTSGRIILEADDEQAMREALADWEKTNGN